MEKSAFKTLYTQMLQNGGDYNALPSQMRSKDLQVFVKETRTFFLVSDSYFYVPAYFTNAAITEYNSKFPNLRITDLESKVIVITKWSLELKKVDSKSVFTSYADVECRLIVHAFKPQLKGDALHPTRFPSNLYRDDEFKMTVQAFRHNQVRKAVAGGKASQAGLGSGKVSQGCDTVGTWSFKEGNTKAAQVVAISQKKILADKAAKAAVKGGVKKTAAKKAAKTTSAVEKLMGKKSAGKATKTGKKSVSKTKATPDAGKRSKASTGKMTVTQYRKFLANMKKTKK